LGSTQSKRCFAHNEADVGGNHEFSSDHCAIGSGGGSAQIAALAVTDTVAAPRFALHGHRYVYLRGLLAFPDREPNLSRRALILQEDDLQ